MDSEELLEIDHPIAVLVEILEGLRDEDGRAALRADLGKDEVLELVLGQNLQKKQRSGASVHCWASCHSLSFGEFPWLVGRYCSYLLPKQAGGTPQILIFKT